MKPKPKQKTYEVVMEWKSGEHTVRVTATSKRKAKHAAILQSLPLYSERYSYGVPCESTWSSDDNDIEVDDAPFFLPGEVGCDQNGMPVDFIKFKSVKMVT